MITPSKEFLEVFKKTEGALSVCESIAIMNIAQGIGNGLYAELGSHKGKSGMSASFTLPKGEFLLIDPIFEDKDLANEVMLRVLCAHPKTNGIYVTEINGYSTDIIPKYNNYSYVFVDSGSHGDGLPMQEVKLLEDRMVRGGVIAFHDFDSQFKEVREAYDYLVSTGKYTPMHINWSEIINYVRENNLEQGNNSWHHQEMEFPCFVGAVKRN